MMEATCVIFNPGFSLLTSLITSFLNKKKGVNNFFLVGSTEVIDAIRYLDNSFSQGLVLNQHCEYMQAAFQGQKQPFLQIKTIHFINIQTEQQINNGYKMKPALCMDDLRTNSKYNSLTKRHYQSLEASEIKGRTQSIETSYFDHININEKILKTEIINSERKIQEHKFREEQLLHQLDKSHHQQAVLQGQLRQALRERAQHSVTNPNNVDLILKSRQQQAVIEELMVQIQKWKSYRCSQEDQARRETRMYKKKLEELQFIMSHDKKAMIQESVDQATRETRHFQKRIEDLEDLLNAEKKTKIDALQEARIAYDSLKMAAVAKETDHLQELQRQKQISTSTLDQLEGQFRKLVTQLEEKMQKKQAQVEEKQKIIAEFSLRIEKERSVGQRQVYSKKEAEIELQKFTKLFAELEAKSIKKDIQFVEKQKILTNIARQLDQQRLITQKMEKQRKQARFQIQSLNQDLVLMQKEVSRLQDNSKRQAESIRVMAYAEAEQREMKVRYEKLLEEKVLDIQRLKLDCADLQEEIRKGASLKRQLEVSQNSLKMMERDDIEKTDKIRYLSKTVESLEGDVRAAKKSKEDLTIEIRNAQRDLNTVKDVQKTVIELERDLQIERNKNVRLSEEKERTGEQKRRLNQEWRQKYDDLQTSKERAQSTASMKEKQLQRTIYDLQDKLNKKYSSFSSKEKQLANTISDLEQKYNQKILTSDRLQSQIGRLQNEVCSLTEKEKNNHKQIEELKTHKINYQRKQINLQNSIEEQSKAIYSYEKKQISLEKTVQEQDRVINSQEKKRMSLEKNIEDQDQIINNYEKKQVSLQKTVQEQDKAINNFEKKQASLEKVVQEQDKAINGLNNDKKDQTRQIQILLERIQLSQLQFQQNSIHNIQGQELRRSARLGRLEKLARLAGLPNIDQERSIEGISEWAINLMTRTSELELTVKQCKSLLAKLNDEKQNYAQKYSKYKNIVIDMKERKDKERILMKNAYNFEQKILNRCQNIIRGDIQ